MVHRPMTGVFASHGLSSYTVIHIAAATYAGNVATTVHNAEPT
jgi:hypothetical protein